MTALSSFCAARLRAADSVFGRLPVAGDGRLRLLLQRREPLGAGIDQRQVAFVAARQRRELVDRYIIFAAGRAQREQPLLDAFELGRIEVGHAQRMFEMRARLIQRGQRRVDGFDHRLDQRRRLRRAALQPPHRGRQRRHRRLRSGDGFERRPQILGGFFGLHHGGAALGERGLLAGLRAEPAELVDRMAKPLRFAAGALDLGAMRLHRGLARAPLVPKTPDLGGVVLDAAIGVEQRAMGRRLDESAVVVLAVDFHQSRAERAQHLHAHRLIVDEGAGAAVGELDPAHDQFVLGDRFRNQVVLRQQAARRMLLGDVESRSHLALLGALAHQSGVAARTERERKRVEQDRFAGAGLTGKRGKAGAEVDVQAIDQNDIANGEAGEHDDR